MKKRITVVTFTVSQSSSSVKSRQFWTKSQRWDEGMQLPSAQVNSSSVHLGRVETSQKLRVNFSHDSVPGQGEIHPRGLEEVTLGLSDQPQVSANGITQSSGDVGIGKKVVLGLSHSTRQLPMTSSISLDPANLTKVALVNRLHPTRIDLILFAVDEKKGSIDLQCKNEPKDQLRVAKVTPNYPGVLTQPSQGEDLGRLHVTSDAMTNRLFTNSISPKA